MMAPADIDAALEREETSAAELLALGEHILSHWLQAHDQVPTSDEREGFRLLALHRQAALPDPSFNACRETCRELAWHYNLLQEPGDDGRRQLTMMRFVARHLWLFVGGKLEQAGLGDFCCASRPLRSNDEPANDTAATAGAA